MKRRLVLILCCTFALTGALNAKKKRYGYDDDEGYRRFRQGDVRIIVDYYRGHGYEGGGYYEEGRGLPPGLAKKGKLPPGLAKQLRRNGRLPPGLEKKLMPFPVEVERYMPPCPSGMRRGLIDGRAVIFNERTGIIVDIVAVFGN